MRSRHSERGFAVIMAIVMVIGLAGISTALIWSAATHQQQSLQSVDRAHNLAVTEGAATLLLAELSDDPVGPVKDIAGYEQDEDTYRRAYTPFAEGDGQARVELTYFRLDGGVLTPVDFSNRAVPTELYKRLHASVTGIRTRSERRIEIDFDQKFIMFDDAIVSDAVPLGTGGGGKSLAMEGHIVFNDKGRPGQFFVNGGMAANGDVLFDDTTNPLQTESANKYITFAGEIDRNLTGTDEQIPDYTAPGSSAQLFDFDRVTAAARAGAGQEFTTYAQFTTAMNAANAAGKPLEGITVLSIDPSTWGSTKMSEKDMPGGVNIRGTLVFKFKPGTAPNYKIFIVLPFRINAADLTGLVPSDPRTYTTGYNKPYLDPLKKPSSVNIEPAYQNFTDEDDLPALMFNTGIVDQHGSSNICGLVYGPSFIELENKEGGVQYFNGSILGGAGVYIEGHGSTGYTVVTFDSQTIDVLATRANAGKGLRILSWRTLR